jgi:predicted ATP-dependent endonuclease of OLD family
MINKIHLEKFAPFNNNSLSLRQLNILTGRNNTGKSSVLEALLLIRETYKSGIIYHPNEPATEVKEYEWYENIYSRNIDGVTTLRVELDHEEEEFDFQIKYKYRPLNFKYNSYSIFETPLFSDKNQFYFANFVCFDLFLRNIDFKEKHWMKVLKWVQYIIPEISTENLKDENYTILTHYPYELSSGGSYLLWLLGSIFSLKENSLILIEHPEKHLHPSSQTKFCHLLAELIHFGHQIIIETHSDHIINGLRLSVMQNRINLDKLVFYHFYKNPAFRYYDTIFIDSPKLDKNGRFSYYPVGFLDEWDNTLEKLLGSEKDIKAKSLLDMLKGLEVAKIWWREPLTHFSERREIVFEWWHEQRKLTIYVASDRIDYIKVWGADMDNDMETGLIDLDNNQLTSIWSWLIKDEQTNTQQTE